MSEVLPPNGEIDPPESTIADKVIDILSDPLKHASEEKLQDRFPWYGDPTNSPKAQGLYFKGSLLTDEETTVLKPQIESAIRMLELDASGEFLQPENIRASFEEFLKVTYPYVKRIIAGSESPELRKDEIEGFTRYNIGDPDDPQLQEELEENASKTGIDITLLHDLNHPPSLPYPLPTMEMGRRSAIKIDEEGIDEDHHLHPGIQHATLLAVTGIYRDAIASVTNSPENPRHHVNTIYSLIIVNNLTTMVNQFRSLGNRDQSEVDAVIARADLLHRHNVENIAVFINSLDSGTFGSIRLIVNQAITKLTGRFYAAISSEELIEDGFYTSINK
jgi:hypothetical protein